MIVVGDAEPFTEALVAAVEQLDVGDPAEGTVVMGPVSTDAARQRVLDAVDDARASGGRVLTGARVVVERSGFFVAPTLVDLITARARLAREEVFGPVVAVIGTGSEDEVGSSESTARPPAPSSMRPSAAPRRRALARASRARAPREFYAWTQTITLGPQR